MTITNTTHFLQHLEDKLQQSHEAKFWQVESLKAASIVLTVLHNLQQQNLLFTPEGKPHDTLTLDFLLSWFDLVSLKTLIFTLDESNTKNTLVNTKIEGSKTSAYSPIDVTDFANYLQTFSIDLNEPLADFPSRFYVKHNEYAHVIRRAMKVS